MNKNNAAQVQKLKDIYYVFHAKMKEIIKRQSDLIEKIGRHSDSKKIEKIRDKIRNL